MKCTRVVFYTLLGVCLLGGMISGIREFYLVLVLQLLTLLFGFGLAVWTGMAFSFIQTLDREEAVKGESVHLHLEIHNDRFYPFTRMRVHVQAVAGAENTVLSFSLASKETVCFDLPFTCPYRGDFKLGMTILEIQDIFGLFRIRFPMLLLPYYRQRRLLVLPRADRLKRLPVGRFDRILSEGNHPDTGGRGEDFAYIREYREGDPERSIHWKLSMRERKLYTKQYEQPAQSRCLIFLDTRPAGGKGEAALTSEDLLCEAAATIAHYCLGHAHAVHLYAASQGIAPIEGESPHDFPGIQHWLALLPFSSGESPAPQFLSALHNGVRAPVYVISSSIDGELAVAVKEAAGSGYDVTCVRPARGEAPPEGVADAVIPQSGDITAALEALL